MSEKITPQEIKEKIDWYNQQIENNFYPHEFTLNNKIGEWTKNIKELQSLCTHEFKNGYCIYCYKGEN